MGLLEAREWSLCLCGAGSCAALCSQGSSLESHRGVLAVPRWLSARVAWSPRSR